MLVSIVLSSVGTLAGVAAALQHGSSTQELRPPSASLTFGDCDGDGLPDALAVGPDGALFLLRNLGDGAFEDISAFAGLSEVRGASVVLWQDYDGDQRLDLFVGTSCGPRHLFHNKGAGSFEDVASSSGLGGEGCGERLAQWMDYDRDGRLDLHLEGDAGGRLYHALPDGRFEELVLSVASGAACGPIAGGFVGDVAGPDRASGSGPARGKGGSSGGSTLDGMRVLDPVSFSASSMPTGPNPSSGMTTPLVATTLCSKSIRDQANPGTCIQASTIPALGKLYPLSTNLFVSTGGDVGMGTTSPAAKLEVAGTARVTDTLTLNPSGDTALDVSTGSIYKGGALFIHTKGGAGNTALGRNALPSVTPSPTNFWNTAIGYRALFSNTDGHRNTAIGGNALYSNTTGGRNTASGYRALKSNTTGNANAAIGYRALTYNTTGSANTAIGYALLTNTTGNSNTATGVHVLSFNTTGSYNTASGQAALTNNTTGNNNTATGRSALTNNTTGNNNTAIGNSALINNMTGSRNIAIGYLGGNVTSGNDNITIGSLGVAAESATIRIGAPGTHTRAFIAGIRGVTTGIANAITVMIDGNGQLGTMSSSRRFKKDIADMGKLTDKLLELRPVVFHYKQEQTLPNGAEVPLEYGLIAEEVAEIFPDLVVYDEEGKPFTVKYHLLSAMLLNELKKQAHEVAELHERLETEAAAQVHDLDELRSEMEVQRSRLTALEALATKATPPAPPGTTGQ